MKFFNYDYEQLKFARRIKEIKIRYKCGKCGVYITGNEYNCKNCGAQFSFF